MFPCRKIIIISTQFQMSNFTRRISIVAGIFILVISVFSFRALSSMEKMPEKKNQTAKVIPELSAIKVENSTVQNTLDIQGELQAFDKIDIFSEVAGVLKPNAKAFKEGNYFKKGDIILQIDDEEARLALLSQKSALLNAITQLMPDLKIDYGKSYEQWKSYLDNFDMQASIKDFPKPLNEQEKYFIASRNLYTQFYNIKSAETRLKKYTIHAPFGGVVTASNTNSGSLVQPGQKLGALMNPNVYELKTTIALSDLKFIKGGDAVELISDEIEGKWTGKVRRINDQIDRSTQTVSVFIGVSGAQLREGMYLRGAIYSSKIENAIAISRDLIINQNYVYSIEEEVLKLKGIEIVSINNNEAIVTGLENGTVILSQSFPTAFEGMKVKASL